MKFVSRLLLLGVLLFALSGAVLAAEDLPGFKGFVWGTNFEVVNREKNLEWFENNDERGMHMSLSDGETDEKGHLRVGYLFGFYQNKLVSGEVQFFSKPDYANGIKVLEKNLGSGFYHQDKNVYSYMLPSTIIFCQPDRQRIIFLDRKYHNDKEKRDQAAKKEKNNQKYDQFFN